MIEILIALVILSFGFLPIYNLFRQGSATTVNNIQENIATNYASDLINFCKDLKYYQINSATDDKKFELKNDTEIQNFFSSKLDLTAPPSVQEPFNRSVIIEKYDTRGIVELIKDIIANRKKVPSYMVTVKVTFPKMSGKGEDDVTIYSIIMD